MAPEEKVDLSQAEWEVLQVLIERVMADLVVAVVERVTRPSAMVPEVVEDTQGAHPKRVTTKLVVEEGPSIWDRISPTREELMLVQAE